MKKYYWDNNDLLNYINKLPELIEQEPDFKRKCYLLKVLDHSKHMLIDRFGNDNPPKESIKQRLHSTNSEIVFYGRYYSIINDFFNSLAPLLASIYEIEDKLEKLFGETFDMAQITGAYMTNNRALSLTATFFDTFDHELKPYFDEVFADRFNFLRFKRIKTKSNQTDSDGNTLFIDGVRKNFITVRRTKDADKVFTLAHEYGHASKYLFNPESAYSCDDGFFVEVDGIFPELVALHENIGDIDPLYVAFSKYSTLINYFEYADYLSVQNDILNCWKDNGMRINRDLKDVLKKDHNIDEEMFKEILYTSIFEEGVYVISYIVSMELLHIYKRDKEKAIQLYNQFLGLPANEELFPFVCSLVRLNENIFEEANDVVTQMKLELGRYEAKNV